MWIKIRSWHRVRLTRSLTQKTMCGRLVGDGHETSDDLPAGKSCESCLRILARQVD